MRATFRCSDQVVVLRQRGRERGPQPMKMSPGGKPGAPADARERSAKCGADEVQRVVHLGQRLERRRQRPVLEEVALPRRRVVEQPPAAADDGLPAPLHVPDAADARRDVVPVGLVGAARHARIAGIDEPGRRRRKARRLLAGVERVQLVAALDERRGALVAQAGLQLSRARPASRPARRRSSPTCGRPCSDRPPPAGTAAAGRAGSRRRRCRCTAR